MSMTLLLEFLTYLALGAGAGTLAGLFGIGGGLIIVPVLFFGFQAQGVASEILMHLAVGTSLATIVFTSMSSIRTHHQQGGVLWALLRPMAVGITLGALLGAVTASYLPSVFLQRLIGVFAVLVAFRMVWSANPKAGRIAPGAPGLVAAGGFIGWVSAIVGIGGGTLTVPFLSWCNVRMQQAIGTSAACGFPIAVAGALGNVMTGWQQPGLPAYSLGFIYLPALLGIALTSVPFARLGALLAHRLPAQTLKRIFAALLLIIGVRFLIG